ncbi:phage integrase N-terminal SAM-like domain-containing protein [Lyngbya confervoides]|uniref:phage integrase N-terminal SAM-like domain-containing protein n=1 Tax=Lyngbya confervoides TaxID=207921 RepID=UPI0035C8C025
MEQIKITTRLKHFSVKTEKSYLYHIRDLIRFPPMRHPRAIVILEIQDHFSY